jgi:YVTN family beta-propeller protein
MNRKNITFSVLGAIIGLATLGMVAASAQGGIVYTADEEGGSISAIDLGTGAVETVPVSIMPHNVQISVDGRQVYAVGMAMTGPHTSGGGGHATGGGRLVILDSANLQRSIAEIPIGPHPAHVVTSPDGKLAFVTDSRENAIHVIDLTIGQVIRTIGTGAYPHGLRASPDGRELYVANLKDESVSVIDVAELRETARIKVGSAPVQVGFTPDGSKVFVALNGENKVAVIERPIRRPTAKIPVGRNPVQLHATPDGRHVYVANQGTSRSPDNTVSVIDVAQNRVIATVTTGRGAHGVVISDDGELAFVSNIIDSTVSVLDTATHAVVRSFKVGRGPNGITFRRSDGSASQ